MDILFHKKFLNHNPESMGEGAYRVEKFVDISDNVDVNGEEFISLVHTERYLQKIKRACMCKGELAEIKLSPESYEIACTAVGVTILASEQHDFAVVRPPGHHAGREKAAGFCLFNNVAIATQKLVNEGKRVFILDIDGHHGDGTQSIFYNTDQVFFCSIHQKDTYPFSGTTAEIGKGKGEGFTLNIPLSAKSSDREFLLAVDFALQKAKAFSPDVVAVSAGFDGFSEDRILALRYSLRAFYECGLRLRENFENIFGVLEGGYHKKVKECVESFVAGVNGEKVEN